MGHPSALEPLGRPRRNSSPPRILDLYLAAENRCDRLITLGPEQPARRGWCGAHPGLGPLGSGLRMAGWRGVLCSCCGSLLRAEGVTRKAVHLGTHIVWGVAAEGVKILRGQRGQRPDAVDAAASVAGGVAGEGAADHARRTATRVVEAAATVLAELLVKVQPLTVAVPTLSRPPPSVAELRVKVQPLTVAVPTLSRPPPSARAELRVKVLQLTVAGPTLSMPPPKLGGVAGEGAAAHRRRPDVVNAAARWWRSCG